MMSVLVTGGAGYIGSHTVRRLQEQGRDVVVYDNLITGHPEAVQGCPLVVGDIFDKELLKKTFAQYKIDGVIHFAAFSLVGESMTDPSKYYYNNLAGTLSLLDAMRAGEIHNIVFSSTAATFGEPVYTPIDEAHPQHPTNVYGTTKLMMEQMLRDFDMAYGIRSVALRYFNACGAHKSGSIGEDHNPETHLIPIILSVLNGKREKVTIFGEDYATPDGTCIRDYIHVNDLADAHILAVDKLRSAGKSSAYNLGNGSGFSVREVIQKTQEATGQKVAFDIGQRRAGDPGVLIATSEKAMQELHWKPSHADLGEIIEDAWRWHRSHPDGYKV